MVELDETIQKFESAINGISVPDLCNIMIEIVEICLENMELDPETVYK